MGLELLRVLDGDLNDNLEVLTEVVVQHFLQAVQGLVDREVAKVIHQPFSVHLMGEGNDTLDVMDIGVVFEGLIIVYHLVNTITLSPSTSHYLHVDISQPFHTNYQQPPCRNE